MAESAGCSDLSSMMADNASTSSDEDLEIYFPSDREGAYKSMTTTMEIIKR
jgi:hypothetical protein